MPQKQLPILRSALLTFLLILAPASLSLAQRGRTAPAAQSKTSLHLRWPAQPGVLRYRLQLAHDEEFNDIVFDRAVFGTEYLVTDLSPGKYYWRFAPAAQETGTYSKPRLVEITGRSGTDTAEYSVPPVVRPAPTPSLATPLTDTGWRTTTGPVALPLMAHLRSASHFDIV